MSAASNQDSSARDLARVKRAHDMGKTKFILLRGVLGWGVPMFVVLTVLPAFRAVPWFPFVAVNPTLAVPLGAVIWLGGGCFLGAWLWKTIERRYAELTSAGRRAP